jgi:hypothetical protein
MTMVNKKGIAMQAMSVGGGTTSKKKQGQAKAKQESVMAADEDEDDVLMGTVKLEEKGKKKAHQFKLDKEKISQPVCIKYYEPLDLVAFALVNR